MRDKWIHPQKKCNSFFGLMKPVEVSQNTIRMCSCLRCWDVLLLEPRIASAPLDNVDLLGMSHYVTLWHYDNDDTLIVHSTIIINGGISTLMIQWWRDINHSGGSINIMIPVLSSCPHTFLWRVCSRATFGPQCVPVHQAPSAKDGRSFEQETAPNKHEITGHENNNEP